MKLSIQKKIIAKHILTDISRVKDNQAMKCCQPIEYNKKLFFFKHHAENEAE